MITLGSPKLEAQGWLDRAKAAVASYGTEKLNQAEGALRKFNTYLHKKRRGVFGGSVKVCSLAPATEEAAPAKAPAKAQAKAGDTQAATGDTSRPIPEPNTAPEIAAHTHNPAPDNQPQAENIPVFSFNECCNAVTSGLLGISTIPAYKAAFGSVGLVNGITRLVKTRFEKPTCFTIKKIAAGALGIISVWSGINGFTNILNFNENFTNISHLISAIDFAARPSFLGESVDNTAGSAREAFSGVKNHLTALEYLAKWAFVAPILVKTVPIFYGLLTK